jgi:tRNA(fMet)-specific endonuclease VapC
MKYLLDTDHLSILQRQTGNAYDNLLSQMSRHPLSDFSVSIITFHEQLIGSHTYVNHARNNNDLIEGYNRMNRLVASFMSLPELLSFDRSAMDIFSSLKAQRIQIGTMDLRIASIAISENLILLTRNQKDFIKVPSLEIQDWTIGD